ncbi:MAG: hypothetical protein ACR2IF_09280 [Terriglobales bacterium]
MQCKLGKFCAVLVLLTGVAVGQEKAAKAAANGARDVCSLVSSAEFQAVQGEAFRATQPNVQNNGAFDVYQCFYTAPTFSKSVALEVIRQKQAPGATKVRKFWSEKFHHRASAEEQDDKTERGKPSTRAAAREENEEEHSSLRPVAGVGEEAYWTGTGIGAALYVLQGERILRVSIGGPETEDAKIRKATVLAQDALRRM